MVMSESSRKLKKRFTCVIIVSLSLLTVFSFFFISIVVADPLYNVIDDSNDNLINNPTGETGKGASEDLKVKGIGRDIPQTNPVVDEDEEEIPQTNPADINDDPQIITVYVYVENSADEGEDLDDDLDDNESDPNNNSTDAENDNDVEEQTNEAETREPGEEESNQKETTLTSLTDTENKVKAVASSMG